MFERQDKYDIVRVRDFVPMGAICIPHGYHVEIKLYTYNNAGQRIDVNTLTKPALSFREHRWKWRE